ncbi:peptide/nickel transport system permease protein [Micromonospora viridifaciens]|uniref:Peptide/nickel transport system permease protein n=1 Tax=Micromonospora viridifaciens TaxID=1881 RepID=A0A1C4WSJ4_MICVI|nr:ABC transporter permease [Micromonospora viridifaciens]SCE99144.1 peptide/nickel transport system permease protein [Micromonospora viridifaciens]
MILYLVRKLTGAAAVLLVLSAFVFMAGRGLAPGNPARTIAGPKASPETIAEIEHSLGLDKPVWQQYVDWLGNAIRGDFGVSPLSGQRNIDVILQQAPVSLELALLGLLIAIVIGVPAGVYSATRAGTARDWLVRLPLVTSFAFPAFVFGSAALYVATHYLTNLYSPTYISITDGWLANIQTMLLPGLAVGIPTAPLIMQMTRSSMLEVLQTPYVATARTSGIAEWRVVYVYALRAALPPVLTLIGFIFGLLVGGLFIVEQIFSLPGLGRGLLDSIAHRDFTQVTGQALVLAAAFILGNVVVDLLLPIVDRRIVRS